MIELEKMSLVFWFVAYIGLRFMIKRDDFFPRFRIICRMA